MAYKLGSGYLGKIVLYAINRNGSECYFAPGAVIFYLFCVVTPEIF